MKKQTIFLLIGGIFLFIALLVGFVWWWDDGFKVRTQGNYLETEISGNSGVFSASETSFDFGNISMTKGVVNHIFKIKNAGEGPLVIPKIYTSCMCTTAFYLKRETRKGPFGMQGHGISRPLYEKLEVNEEAEIEVAFDPNAHGPAGVGPIQREIILEQEGKEPLKLTIKALVTP